MKKIIESPYYFSVNKENNFYGLLNVKQNRFYMLSENYSLLKFLQLMLLKNFYTFFIISFRHFKFDTNKNIDNHDCIEWGGTSNIVNSLEFDANTSMYETALVRSETVLPIQDDLELQEKIFFVMDILIKLDELFKKIREHEIYVKKPLHDGHIELKKYFEIICPMDKNINNFINNEIEQLQVKSLELDMYWNKLILFFYNANFRNNSVGSLLNSFKEYVQTPEFNFERFKRLYQHPQIALDQFCKILGIITKY